MRPPFAAILSVSLLAADAQSAETKLAGHRFRLPEGFSIEIAAPPSLAERPVNACLSPDGRLFVTVSSGSSIRPVETQNTNPQNRIVCLEDTTGTGHYDRATVFAEKVPFPEGILWFENAVYVAAPPAIWKFTDANGDGVSDGREKWFDGKTITGCANDLHGPYAGPDGFLYWTKGAFAEQEVPHFRSRTVRKDRAAHIFRSRPDGSLREAVMSGGMDNPVGISFTSTGDLLFSSTFLDLSGEGTRDGIGHAVRGGVFPKTNDVTDDVPRTGPLLPALTHFGAGAPSGLARLLSPSNSHGPDAFLTALFNLQKVVRHELRPRGSTFESIDSDFVVSDNRDFHPTDVLEDSDGSVLIVDTGGWYKVCCPTSQISIPDVFGCIYRIRRDGAPRLVDPYGNQIDFSNESTRRLIELFKDSRSYVVEKAVRELAVRGEKVVPALDEALTTNGTEPRIGETALRALFQNGTANARASIRKALGHPAQKLRILAAHFAGMHQDKEALAGLFSMLNPAPSEWSEHLRRTAIEALGQIGETAAVARIFECIQNQPGDAFLQHSAIYALAEINDPAGVRAALSKHREPLSQRTGLIALSEMPAADLHPGDIVPHLLGENALLRETAAFLAARHPEWGGAIAGHLSSKLSVAEPPLDPEILTTLLTRMTKDISVQQLAVQLCRHPQPWGAGAGLQTIARSGLKTPPDIWAETVAALLENGAEASGVEIFLLQAAKTILTHAPFRKRVLPALRLFCERPNLSASLRVLAASAQPVAAPLSDVVFSSASELLSPSNPMADRLAAADVVGRSVLTAEQRQNLVSLIPTIDAVSLLRALPGLVREADSDALESVLAALDRFPDKSALSTAAVRGALEAVPPSLSAKRDSLLEQLDASVARQRHALLDLEKNLPAGDVTRGRTVFNSVKASCTLCHKQGFYGGKLGPDLTAIGSVRSRRDLLEAIVYPSASFVRSYETVVLKTQNQGDLRGIVRSESSAQILLATGPNSETSINREAVTEIRPDPVSLMPPGYDAILSQQELSDLVTYLESCSAKPAAAR